MTPAPVFANRILNLKKIKYIGLDMDHTLIRYHTHNFESLVYRLVISRLIKDKNYPESMQEFTFHFDHAIRGLVIDSKNGNILKLNRYGAIRTSYHGTRPIDYAEQKLFYRSTYVDLNDPNYIVIDTSFSIAFCVLYAQLIDLKETLPQSLPSYHMIALDVLSMVDKVHGDGSLKSEIAKNLEYYVIQDPNLVHGLRRYTQFKKKLFVLTNSEFHYTKRLLDYAITPFLPNGETWNNLFEFVITVANKPRFFYDALPFLTIDAKTGYMSNWHGCITPGIYQGGNAKKFTDDLHLNGDEILYIGDHIYGDILRLKKDCNWRTAMVVEELGAEISAQLAAKPIEENIIKLMKKKKTLEYHVIELQTLSIDQNTSDYTNEIQQIQNQLSSIDQEITLLLKKQNQLFNPMWDRVFRAGAEESYFAYQVERYACIYMEKLSDLLSHSPLTYFRAVRRWLPHDHYEENY